jgi:hypothetical protein
MAIFFLAYDVVPEDLIGNMVLYSILFMNAK